MPIKLTSPKDRELFASLPRRDWSTISDQCPGHDGQFAAVLGTTYLVICFDEQLLYELSGGAPPEFFIIDYDFIRTNYPGLAEQAFEYLHTDESNRGKPLQ